MDLYVRRCLPGKDTQQAGSGWSRFAGFSVLLLDGWASGDNPGWAVNDNLGHQW